MLPGMIPMRSERKQAGAAIRWCFTYNNYNEEDEELENFNDFLKMDCKLAIVGKEKAPTTGTKHLQGYVELYYRQRLTALKKINNKIHWEQAKGDRIQNYNYCTKEGDIYFKKGTTEWQRKKAQDDKWGEAMELAQEGKLSELQALYPAIYTSHIGAFQRIAAEEEIKRLEIYNGELRRKNIWLWGEPGTGKSRWANSKFPLNEIYRKMATKWWDGYDILNHRMILIEDWPSVQQLDMGHHMKIWSDRYPFRGETKGGMVTINPGTFIVVTSNYPIDQCFAPQDVPAIKRRFAEIEMKKENQTIVNAMDFNT
jgi:hypothetical protein